MKKIVLLFVLVLSGYAAQAQDIYWETNVDKAAQLAMKTNKPLLLFFTGSDWCGWCIRLQKEVLKTAEFANWAQENAVLVELDFPKRTPQQPEIQQQNSALQQMFQVQGYPTIWSCQMVRNRQSDCSQKINFSLPHRIPFRQLREKGFFHAYNWLSTV
jgi:protein disulfide-isomerase